MKPLINIVVLLLCQNCYAWNCQADSTSVKEGIEIHSLESDDEQIMFTAPSSIDGVAIDSISVALFDKRNSSVFGSLVGYEINGAVVQGYMLLTLQDARIELYAHYGKEKCGPGRIGSFNT